jgi:hypothetical protein
MSNKEASRGFASIIANESSGTDMKFRVLSENGAVNASTVKEYRKELWSLRFDQV